MKRLVLSAMADSNSHNPYSIKTAKPGTDRERDDRFYALLAGGAKTRLLEVFVELDMTTVIGNAGCMTASEICRHFAFQSDWDWKFCRLLALCGLHDEEGGAACEDNAFCSVIEATLTQRSKENGANHTQKTRVR